MSGDGDFTISYAADGTTTTGTWEATKLIGYQSYGSTDLGEGLVLFGGSLQLQITLYHNGMVQKGIPRLTCTDFGHPPLGAVQGMRLKVVGGQQFTSVWAFDAGGSPVDPPPAHQPGAARSS